MSATLLPRNNDDPTASPAGRCAGRGVGRAGHFPEARRDHGVIATGPENGAYPGRLPLLVVQLLLGLRVPKPHGAVRASRQEPGTIGRQEESGDRADMPVKDTHSLSRGGFILFDLVARGGVEVGAVHRECDMAT